MKKVITLAVALLLVSVLSLTAFAAPSIQAPDYQEFDGGVVEIVEDANTDEVTYTADPDDGYEFVDWVITGVEGVDYEIVKGSVDGTPIVIRPLTDKFSITPNFTLVDSDDIPDEDEDYVGDEDGDGIPNDKDEDYVGDEDTDEDTSPGTGDFAATAVLAVAALGLVATKKYAR